MISGSDMLCSKLICPKESPNKIGIQVVEVTVMKDGDAVIGEGSQIRWRKISPANTTYLAPPLTHLRE
jgi:hypothetical protein